MGIFVDNPVYGSRWLQLALLRREFWSAAGT
jgi:hypothetical protein